MVDFYSDFPRWLRAFLEYLEHEREASPKTIEAYEGDLVDLYRILKSEGLVLAGSHDDLKVLRRYLHVLSGQSSREGKMKASSIGRKLAAVRSFIKFLVKREILEFNAARLLKTPKSEKRLPNIVSERTMAGLLKDEGPIVGDAGKMKDKENLGTNTESENPHPSSLILYPRAIAPSLNSSIPVGFGVRNFARSI
jgi:site-specific recombinase XerD